MNTLTDDLRTDLLQARADLIDARRAQQDKDTPDHRAAVGQQRDRVDALLDLYLDLSASATGVAGQLARFSTVSELSSRSLT
jgi:hypothetical protein